MEREIQDHSALGMARFFSLHAFSRGLFVVALFYIALISWLWLKAEDTSLQQEIRLASQTVLINQALPSDLSGDLPGDEAQSSSVAGEEIPEHSETALASAAVSSSTEQAELSPLDYYYEETDDGFLPVKRDGKTAFQAYRKGFNWSTVPAGTPVISLALVNGGLSQQATEQALDRLPNAISIALSPYATDLNRWVKKIRQNGNEIWLELPVESTAYPQDDTGPNTLLIGAPIQENTRKLEWLMSRAKGYAGFITSEDPAFMDASNDVRPVLSELFARGLALVNTQSQPSSTPRSTALGMNAAYATADIWLDETTTAESLKSSLQALEESAAATGHAVGLFHPHPVSLQEVKTWLDRVRDKNIIIAPLSAQTDIN